MTEGVIFELGCMRPRTTTLMRNTPEENRRDLVSTRFSSHKVLRRQPCSKLTSSQDHSDLWLVQAILTGSTALHEKMLKA